MILKEDWVAKVATEQRTVTFIVPAGKKWKLTTTESKGTLFSTYLPL